MRVLTDPVWGAARVAVALRGAEALSAGAGGARARCRRSTLVIVSHDHYDHLDYPTIRELRQRDVPFVTSLGVGAHLRGVGRAARAHHRARLVGVAPSCRTATLVDHRRAVAALLGPRSERTATRRLWSSIVIARRRAHAVFFSGDTGLTTEYATIRERLGPFDLVMLEVGAFHPSWGDIHLGPENALEALRAARRRRVPAGALGHVQPGDARVGRAGRDAARARSDAARAAADAAAGRGGRAVLHEHVMLPWWRGVDALRGRRRLDEPAPMTLPKSMPWPID